jgi:SRSO17 transposase
VIAPPPTPAIGRRQQKRLDTGPGGVGEFAAEVFAPLARRDQRDKGVAYVRGLLLDGRRKSMQPMAERLGVDHQGLQQFVSSSTWAVEPVRQRLARRAVRVIDPDAWVIDDIGFVKDGTASPGWPGSTPARWARSVTARSGSASAR